MAITPLQAKAQGNTALAFPSAVTAGSTIVVCFAGETQPSSIADTLGNTYTKRVELSADREVSIWTAPSPSGGANTVTLTGSAGSHMCISEWASADALEVDDTGTASQTTGTPHSCGSVTSTADAVFISCSRVTNPYTYTVAAGYSELPAGAGATSRALFQYEIVVGSATQSATWQSGTNENVTSSHLALKEAAGPTDQPYKPWAQRGPILAQ